MKILPPYKVYIAKSPIHGWGVFANDIIYEGEIIEETPYYDLKIPKGEGSSLMNDYRFNWPQGSGANWEISAQRQDRWDGLRRKLAIANHPGESLWFSDGIFQNA